MDIFVNSENPCRENILAVLVTFHPDDVFPERVAALSRQVGQILVVDNCSSSSCVAMIEATCRQFRADLILNDQNMGVATALNQGIDYARRFKKGILWILTLDQDTRVFPELVKTLISVHERYPTKERVAIIGANYVEKTTGRLLHEARAAVDSGERVLNLPTSGSLISLNILDIVGRFRDEFFIDYVDTELCIRIRKSGYVGLIATAVLMEHPLGYYKSSKLYKMLTGRDMVTNYPPIRHYYWTRNGLVLSVENITYDFKWALRELYYILIRRVLIVLVFEDKKIEKLTYISRGVIDGVFRKRGRVD